MVIDENNEVAVKRYRDVETILSFFKTGNDELANQIGQFHPRESSEKGPNKSDYHNGFPGHIFKQKRRENWKFQDSWKNQDSWQPHDSRHFGQKSAKPFIPHQKAFQDQWSRPRAKFQRQGKYQQNWRQKPQSTASFSDKENASGMTNAPSYDKLSSDILTDYTNSIDLPSSHFIAQPPPLPNYPGHQGQSSIFAESQGQPDPLKPE